MSKSLPANASFEQLKKQAKDVLHAHGRKDASVCAVLRNLNRFKDAADAAILDAELDLHNAQFALAMEYGFKSWGELKARVEGPANVSVLGETPEHPELDYVRQQVKNLLEAHGRKDPQACPIFRKIDRFAAASDAAILAAAVDLNDAQLAVAMAYGFKEWIELRAHTEEWRNRPVKVPGPIKSVADVMALPDGAVQFILRHMDDGPLAVLLDGEPAPMTARFSASIPAGRLEYCRRLMAESGGKPTLDASRQFLVDVANDLHGRFRGFNLPGETRKGILPRVTAMSRADVIRWGREAFIGIAGTTPASRRTMAELVTLFKGVYALGQFPLAVDAVAREFADEPLVRLGLLAAPEGADCRIRRDLDAERAAALERFGQRQDAVIASDCGFTRRAELREHLEAAGGDGGPFRTVADVAALADGGLELVVGYLRGSVTAALVSMEPPQLRERFAASLPAWWRDSMREWLEEMPGADAGPAVEALLKTANGLHAVGALARPGEAATGEMAPLTLKSHAELAAWAKAEFIRVAGAKPSSQRDLAELESLFRGFAAISLFPLAAETVAVEFADEELVRMAATQFVTTRPGGGVRHTMELKAKALAVKYARRLDLIVEAALSMAHGESDEMLVARCEAFL
ncbi:MAG: hypothetical protein AAB152_03820 [Candidatus Coatesbacteria bacterium]